MLSKPPCSSHSIWRARADCAATCCSAIRTVSETPVVRNSRCAAVRRSSSRSINLLVVAAPPDGVYIVFAYSIYDVVVARCSKRCLAWISGRARDTDQPGEALAAYPWLQRAEIATKLCHQRLGRDNRSLSMK